MASACSPAVTRTPAPLPYAATTPAAGPAGDGGTTAAVDPAAPAPPDLDICTRVAFGNIIWTAQTTLDGGLSIVRTSGGTEVSRSTFPENAHAVESGAEGCRACAFTDAAHGWCAAMTERSDGDRQISIFGTRDGGATWSAAQLPRATYMEWGPSVTLRARNARNVTATVFNGPGHRNGHMSTLWLHASSDGGVTWHLVRKKSECHDKANRCRAG